MSRGVGMSCGFKMVRRVVGLSRGFGASCGVGVSRGVGCNAVKGIARCDVYVLFHAVLCCVE